MTTTSQSPAQQAAVPAVETVKVKQITNSGREWKPGSVLWLVTLEDGRTCEALFADKFKDGDEILAEIKDEPYRGQPRLTIKYKGKPGQQRGAGGAGRPSLSLDDLKKKELCIVRENALNNAVILVCKLLEVGKIEGKALVEKPTDMVLAVAEKFENWTNR